MDTQTLVSDAELAELGYTAPDQVAAARAALEALVAKRLGRQRLLSGLKNVLARPRHYLGKEGWTGLAQALLDQGAACAVQPGAPVPHAIWGRELLDEATLDQFRAACTLPVAVRAAQMPDGHVGYGLPIGGVLATRGAVVPYAVGVDIGCRMRLSIFDAPASLLNSKRDRLRRALLGETRFGLGSSFEAGARRDHPVMDDGAWAAQPLLGALREKAWSQLGSSGSGNHFAEFGELTTDGVPERDLPAGTYLALLTHSGSRALGSEICTHFTRLATTQRRLPPGLERLAWLDLGRSEGDEYWAAMQLAGRYAAANHELIHEHVGRSAGLAALATVENHHNFAWLEEHEGEPLVVHRKGATPAGAGVLGVIPGSMADAGYVVRGLGHPQALNSASHGAGRALSRKQATARIRRSDRDAWLSRAKVELLGAGLDESPQAYRRLERVMAAQRDLVEPVAQFVPRLVLMADGGRAED